jgi:DNA modification methylase
MKNINDQNRIQIIMKLLHGDCLEQMKTLPDNSVDAIVSDPPYGISFMAKKWDYDVPKVEVWQEAMRVLKPGGHALIACGTRTQHRMVVNIEDAGFEIRDVVSWIYGSGFPKSLNVSKAIDKMDATYERRARQLQFTGWMVENCAISASTANLLMGTKAEAKHYFTSGEQPHIATREHFEKLRPHFTADTPDWIEGMVNQRTIESENFKRREVVGTQEMRDTSEVRIAVTSSADTYDEKATRQVNITAPATEAAKQWDGWGTALKPACEFFTLCRKPLSEKTVAANVLKWGTGGINIDGCRVGENPGYSYPNGAGGNSFSVGDEPDGKRTEPVKSTQGRFPANLIHDGSQEVLAGFPETKSGGGNKSRKGDTKDSNTFGTYNAPAPDVREADKGSAARFFYCAKASKKDRNEGNHHPTVKPTALMAYLCRLITPTGGTVLDPYMGSGSTGKAAVSEGFDFIGCELDEEYYAIATARIEAEQNREPEEPDQKELF